MMRESRPKTTVSVAPDKVMLNERLATRHAAQPQQQKVSVDTSPQFFVPQRSQAKVQPEC